MQSKLAVPNMKQMPSFLTAGAVIAGVGAAAFITFSLSSHHAGAVSDPRQKPPLVRFAAATPVKGLERSFTGLIQARVQSNLGFRVPGKVVERLVDAGQTIKAGQLLMRIDDTDLRLALTAKRNAVAAAHAVVVQTSADEKRYAALLNGMAGTPQRYEQAKAALDTAQAQLAAAEAEANVAENEATYSTLIAGADGTVVATFGEPGQVVAAGQTVIQLAHAGPREAVVALPETIRPELGSQAQARVYGRSVAPAMAQLRQISDSADPQTRTYEARYVLEGAAATAPLGSTVTITIVNEEQNAAVTVPIGAVLDDGVHTGVWVLERPSSTVHFAHVQIKRLGAEYATVTGIAVGAEIAALGAHLLKDGAIVRTLSQTDGSAR